MTPEERWRRLAWRLIIGAIAYMVIGQVAVLVFITYILTR